MKKMIYLVMLPTALALLVTFQNCAQGFISQRNMLTTELEPSPPNNINGLMSKNCSQLIASSFHDSPILSSSLNNSDPALKISQLNIEYKAGDGVHNLLDIYHPRDISIKRPILVYIRGGDDGKQGVIANYPNFINYFIQKGFVFASINYRSYMQDKNLKVQDQATDIASGVKWLSSHASDFGGKSDDFVFLGFSTGAYLASLLNADISYLSKVGLSTEILKGSISMDVPHYNEALNLELIQDTYLKPRTPMLLDLFGNTLAQQLASSPVNYINSGRLLKPMLLFTTGEKDGQTQDVSFLATSVFKSELDNANQLAEYYPLKNYEHTELCTQFNIPSGEPVSMAVGHFLDRLYSITPVNVRNKDLDQALFSEIDQTLSPLIENTDLATQIPGAIVGVVSPGYTLLTSCGFTDDTSKQKITGATFFSVGSVTKAFTGLILAKAVKDGHLKLEDRVSNYLQTPLKETFLADVNLNAITFKHLVTHTSGLTSMPSNLLQTDSDNPAAGYTLQLLDACFKDTRPTSGCKPRLGTITYSNLGISLLGIALQSALNPTLNNANSPSYTNFNELLQQYLLFPAGISEIYGESDLLLQPKEYFTTSPHNTVLGAKALNSILSTFSLGRPSSSNSKTTTFADMSVMSPAGEATVTGRSMLNLMKYISGADSTNPVITPELMDEATKVLWSGQSSGKNISMSYATATEKLPNGTDLYKKDGLTSSGYQAYIAWSKQDRSGVFIIINSKSDAFSELKNGMTERLLLKIK